MNKRLKNRWVKALLSGKYKQGRNVLRRVDKDGDKFCCLGVLCEISKRTLKLRTERDTSFDDGVVRYEHEVSYLPDAVSVYAEFSGNPSVMYRGRNCSLSALNDRGVKFKTIAKLIDEQL